MSTFEIQFSPRESAAYDPLDRDAEADIGIFAGGLCLTELEDRVARTVRPTLRASVYRLALWLAENWWRLRWEPESDTIDWRLSHHLSAVGGGYIWPALTLVSDGEYVSVRMQPGMATPTADIRYLRKEEQHIPVESFFSGVDRFVAAVIERMRSTQHPATALECLWAEIQEERHDPETAHWRKLEALAGLDPGAEAGAFLESLLVRQASIGCSGLEELVAECKESTPKVLSQLADVHGQAESMLAMPDIEPLRARIQANLNTSSFSNGCGGSPKMPWQRAYQAADIARQYWGFRSGAISSAMLAEVLGTAEQALFSSDVAKRFRISAGFRDQNSGRLAVTLAGRALTGRRFALARLLGDYLTTSEEERVLPATTTKTARQKFQRAFAQQLLCPVDDLKAFLDTEHPNDEQIEDAATEFDVSPLLIKSTLVNQGILDRHVLQSF